MKKKKKKRETLGKIKVPRYLSPNLKKKTQALINNFSYMTYLVLWSFLVCFYKKKKKGCFDQKAKKH